MSNKPYIVSLEGFTINADSPLEAAKKLAQWMEESANEFIYNVIDEDANKEYTVDLSEEDELIQVLENPIDWI